MSITFCEKRVIGALAALVCATVVACGGGSDDNNNTGGGGGTGTQGSPVPSLSAVAVNPSTVSGGTSSQGTVTLTTAPTAGLPVALSSNNGAATVPSTVTVNSNATSATFNVATSAVAANTSVTITGTLNGANQSATLLLLPPAAPPPVSFTARLSVASLSAAKRKLQNGNIVDVAGKGAGTPNVCPIVADNGGQRLDCEFDGSASTSPNGIAKYRFKWKLGTIDGDEGDQTASKLRPARQNCGFFGGFSNDGSNDDPFLQMIVKLEITSPSGSVATVELGNVSVFPAGQCGYAF